MANRNYIFGAKYHSNPIGGVFGGKIMPFVVLDTDATALFVGDFVKLVGGSALSDYPGLGYLPVVTQAAAGDRSVGWVQSFGVNPNNLTSIYRPASTLRLVFVNTDPLACFSIQSTGTGSAADIGKNADIVVGAGNTMTGISGMQLDHATLGTVDGQLRIIGVNDEPGNNEFGLYTKFICFINEHEYKGIAGI